MQWDLGPQAIVILLAMSTAFGGLAIAILWNRLEPAVSGIGAAAVFFFGSLFISEILFGWATEAELQPNIDGLSFDEVLIAFLVGVPLLVAVRLMLGRRSTARPAQ